MNPFILGQNSLTESAQFIDTESEEPLKVMRNLTGDQGSFEHSTDFSPARNVNNSKNIVIQDNKENQKTGEILNISEFLSGKNNELNRSSGNQKPQTLSSENTRAKSETDQRSLEL